MFSDLRYALRSLLKAPLFTAIVTATIALGIAANTAIFSVVHAVLLKAPPFTDPERLAVVWETDRNTGTTREPASWPDFRDMQQRSRTVSAMGGFIADEMNLSPAQGDPRRVPVLHASHELLPLLGVQPVAGRLFTPEEDKSGGPSVALISDALWQREFGRNPGAIGRTLRIDDTPWTVIGVMPADADFGVMQVLTSAAYGRAFADRGERAQVDIWVPLRADEQQLPRSTHPLLVIGRLAPEATFGGAQAEMAGIAGDLEKSFQDNAARGVNVEPLTQVIFGPVRPALYVLLATVALVLIVACVNVANLLLARGDVRAHEVAVRRALGAGAGTLLRLFVTESLVLTTGASALGVGLAFVGVRLMIALAPADVPRLESARVDPLVLAVTAGVSIVVALFFGVIPAIQLKRSSVQGTLKDVPTRASGSRETGRLQQVLVVAELSLALLLVCGAGLLLKSFWRLQAVDPGFQSHGVLKAEYQLPPARYPVDFRRWPDFKEQHAFNRALLGRAAQLPGVEAAALAGNHPLDPGFTNSFSIVGREAESKTWPEISIRRVSPGYFRTVGLSLVRGRLLEDRDSTTGAPVALINEAAAERFFGKSDPIGHQMRFWGSSRTIVGIVANERIHGLIESAPIAAYAPLAQAPSANGAGVLLVRTSGDPAALASSIRSAIRATDPGLAVFGLEPLDVTMTRSVSQRRFIMLLLSAFALTALVLAGVGVHGMLSYRVARRRQEIGIRMALGAGPGTVLRLVLRDGAILTLIGLALGLIAAASFTRVLRTLLFGVTATDPITFAAVAVFFVLVAMAATIAPAVWASRVDPLTVLRSE
ncbi:MAG TPA: ABC transporter permease [Vicinamibacterales bacterium]